MRSAGSAADTWFPALSSLAELNERIAAADAGRRDRWRLTQWGRIHAVLAQVAPPSVLRKVSACSPSRAPAYSVRPSGA